MGISINLKHSLAHKPTHSQMREFKTHSYRKNRPGLGGLQAHGSHTILVISGFYSSIFEKIAENLLHIGEIEEDIGQA